MQNLPFSSQVEHLSSIIFTSNIVSISFHQVCRSLESNVPQNGMQTPLILSRTSNPLIGPPEMLPASQSAIWLSLILLNPVVATLSCSPIHTHLLFLAPEWPGATAASLCCRVSQIRSFLSREVVARRVPVAFHDNDWTMSPCLRESGAVPALTSHNLMV